MKKNLISAVAAGLALALAITSFGCESGNDTPVHLAYTRARYAYADDAAAEAGDVFTYVAQPTQKDYNTDAVAGSEQVAALEYIDPTDATTKKEGYATTPAGDSSYIDGVQAYDLVKGKVIKEDYTLAPGKIVNTKSETLVFDPATKTFEYYDDSSEWTCKQVVFLTNTEFQKLDGWRAGYIQIVNDGTTGYDINDAIDDAGLGTDAYKAAKSFREADGKNVYYVESRITVKGLTTAGKKYVDEDGNILFAEYTSYDPDSDEPAPIAKGTYAIDGSYEKGTILITSWYDGAQTFLFDDDAGTYTVLDDFAPAGYAYGDNPLDGDIERDFPDKSTEPTSPTPTYNYTAHEFSKKGRTLAISSKTVTAALLKTSHVADETDPTSPVAHDGYEFTTLLNSSHNDYTYARRNYRNKDSVSYKYVLQD